MDWGDLKIFLHLARTRRMTAAAKVLGVDDSTVSRRIARLEGALGIPLVERAGRKTVLTENGLKVAQAAEQLESVIFREIAGLGEDSKLVAGRVRVGAPEGLGVGYLARNLALMSAANERLETELVALPRSYSLAAREVDIAITLERPTAGQLTSRKLTDYTLGLYGTGSYFSRRGKPEAVSDLKHHTFAGYIPEMLFTRELDFSIPAGSDAVAPVISSTSVIAQVNAVRSGAAVGVLPRYLASAHDELAPILPDQIHFVRSYWIAVHDDLKHLHRIRAVFDSIVTAVNDDVAVFMPQ